MTPKNIKCNKKIVVFFASDLVNLFFCRYLKVPLFEKKLLKIFGHRPSQRFLVADLVTSFPMGNVDYQFRKTLFPLRNCQNKK